MLRCTSYARSCTSK